MINGLPGAMAAETARVCLERGLTLIPYGFTGKDPPSKQFVVTTGSGFSKSIELIEGPGVNSDADNMMERIKNEYPNCIIVDYTHPSAVLSNIRCYTGNACDFVMGTTGVELSKMKFEFEKGENFAVIAPNMAKQIVALQYALDQLSNRFPNAYGGYNLKVVESHQSSKADTSGTAKAIVSHITKLNGQDFGVDDIEKIRSPDSQIAFGVPSDALGGHAFHTYTLTSSDGSVSFQLQHNVCGRRIYAEGTVDAVLFLDSIRKSSPVKRLYDMIDVLESGKMT
eukprot:gene35284-45690_t